MADTLIPLVDMFEESENATRSNRELCQRDRDYYDGKQWTADEEATLKKRGQPVVTYNRIQRKIDYLSGIEKQQRKDPKAFPRNPDDEDAANAATDAIRYVCDDEDWDCKRSAAWDDLLIAGTCAVMVGHKDGRDGPDPAIFHIPEDRFFYDPHSSRPDFSDARYMGVGTWYDLDEAEAKWPEKKDVLESTISRAREAGSVFEDKPLFQWADYKRKRVFVIEGYYKKAGAWYRCVATRGGELEESAPSPYFDEDGKPENPIKAASLYVDRYNNRYGAVRVLISPQDEINQRRARGLHFINMRQVRVGLSSSQDAEKIRRELTKPDGIISAEKDDFEILNTGDLARGNLEMLMEAKAEIDLLGANAALAGKNENDMSGRAILAQQQGGMVEVARMFDRLRSLSIDVYRSAWNRIRQFKTGEWWVRVTDNERNLRFVGLNQQVTVAMLAQEVAQGDQKALKVASQLLGPQLLQAALQGDERAQMAVGLFVQQNGDRVVETRNAVNELDVDIIVDESMDTPSVQAEQFEVLAKILPGIVNLPPAYAKALIQASQFRNKDEMLETLEQAHQPNPMMEQQAQIQMAGAEAQVEKVKSETVKNLAQAQAAQAPAEPQSVDPIDAQRVMLEGQQTQIDGFRAETERMEALKPEPPKSEAA